MTARGQPWRLTIISSLFLLQISAFAVVETTLNSTNHTLDWNSTTTTGHPLRFQLFKIKWQKHSWLFQICLWLWFAILVKVVFHHFDVLVKFIPISALEIVLGLLIGAVLYVCKVLSNKDGMLISLTPNFFFHYLLPPILFDAGFSMRERLFMDNSTTIVVYAVLGTLWNAASIGLALYGLGLLGVKSMQMPLFDLLLFATINAALDPVAVLTVFEEIRVNHVLYICVFGESLLNDAVTVVLYHVFESFVPIGTDQVTSEDVVKGIASFFLVSFGGLVIGAVFAALTALFTKFTDHTRVVQPLVCLTLPYLCFLTAETVNVSGLVAIVFCALTMKYYIRQNITHSSYITLTYFLKTISSISETIMFIFVGISAMTKWDEHQFDLVFIAATIVFCVLFRFIGVFLLTSVVNQFRMVKISVEDQFIMAYGGLRGPVCYGLAASLTSQVAASQLFKTTTMLIIIFTIIFLGTTIKPLVKWMKVKRDTDQPVFTLTQKMFGDLNDNAMAGLEAIIGNFGDNSAISFLRHLNKKVLRPQLVNKNRTRDNILYVFRELDKLDGKKSQKSEDEHDKWAENTGARALRHRKTQSQNGATDECEGSTNSNELRDVVS